MEALSSYIFLHHYYQQLVRVFGVLIEFVTTRNS